jgi:hypothetical protein
MKIHRKIKRLAASLSLAVSGSAFASPLTIPNASFEAACDGAAGVGNWSIAQPVAGQTPAIGGLTPTDGEAFLFVNGTDAPGETQGIVYQKLGPLQAGTYTFEVDVGFRTDTNMDATYDIALYAVSETTDATLAREQLPVPEPGTWKKVTLSFTVDGSEPWFSDQLQMVLTTHAGVQVAYDNVRATFTPAKPASPPVRLEGKFGRVEINTERPALESLVLRRADGTLEPHSLLSPQGAPWLWGAAGWGTQALTFAADEKGRRFESRKRAPEAVEKTADGVTLRGVVLTDGAGEPVAREDWFLKVAGDDLVWTVERTWLRELTTTSTGTPALFFSMRPIVESPTTTLPNSVATTFWIAPDKLRGWFNPHYRFAPWPFWFKSSLENNVVVTEPGGWAVLKLFTSWQNQTEPRFAVEDGHLYRRGMFSWLSEVGIVSHPEPQHLYEVGDMEKATLRIRAVPAAASGHQLTVKADDPGGTVGTLRGFYGALLNGGCVNDPLHYNFGNEPDGWYYGGASWMKGLPILAGAPAPEPTAAHPQSLPLAFRNNLQMIIGTEFSPGRTNFGYNNISGGAWTDDNIIQVIGGRAYHLYSGDIAFVRQNLPFYRRAVAWYLGNLNADGLVSLTPAHWYYDAMEASGATTYHNAFLYRALIDLAGMERAAGNTTEAAATEDEAAKLREAINRVLWWEDAPGGPRYVDWITPDGTKIAYAADLCQFPPLAFGIASTEQAKKLIDTIDRRIVELERDHGYAGYASRSAYWPVPESVNKPPQNQGFGKYMNGGSFLTMTYWEIMARAAAGDAEGAWKRLQKFAEGTRLTGERGFIGENWVMEDGRLGSAAGREPFLSDMISVPGALVQGILGIRQTNDKLEVNPVLPAALQKASAEVVHLGMRKRVTIDGKNVKIEELGRAFTPPDEITWQVNAGKPPETTLIIDRTFATGSGWSASPEIDIRAGEGIALKTGSATGTYTTAPSDWGQMARITRLRTTAVPNGSTINARIETSNDKFQTIAATQNVELKDGDQSAAIKDLPPTSQARVVFTLTTPEAAKSSLLLSGMELAAKPE